MRCNQDVIVTGGLAEPLKPETQFAVDRVCRRLERKDMQSRQHRIYLGGQPGRASTRNAVSKFSCHDNARANLSLAHSANVLGHWASRVADQRRYDVRIQQVAH